MSTEPQTTIQITLNGETRQIPVSLTIAGLFELLQMSPEAIIVERNQTVVPRSTFATLTLEPGDRIELMRLIGGG
ncbi:MAG: hypothetical protein GEEBNDBF_00057 [bacterium]|nr:hypothetical protein [bacterium]